MKWQYKAKIMQMCSAVPAGSKLYSLLQKCFGRLGSDPWSGLKFQAEMARWIDSIGMPIEGKVFLEVGTGHKPIVPIGFFLLGAEKVITIDINKRMDLSLLKKSLNIIASGGAELCDIYGHLSQTATFNERIEILRKLKDKPVKFLEKANMQYWAPMDAASTGLEDCSVDCHFSVSVFEHIPINILECILAEARRILKKRGVAIHVIDMSDHFSHQDKSINGINFLRFSKEEWRRIANNEYAYCNRLRASDYCDVFRKSGFSIIKQEKKYDESTRGSVEKGFPLDENYLKYGREDLLCTEIKVLLGKDES